MNYSDLQQIQQDEWSLSRPTFVTPKGGILTVVGWSGKRGHNKCYIVECTECKKDNELNGDAIYSTSKDKLNRGQIPCGCSKSVRWTQNQYILLVKRECEKRSITLRGFSGEFKAEKCQIVFECKIHGLWESSNIYRFLKGSGCPGCERENKVKKRKLDSNIVGRILSTGNFHQDTKFYRLGSPNGFCNYICVLCSGDEFVKEGLCSGVFQTTLKGDRISCRCSKSYRYTKEQWEYRLKKFCRDKGYKFLSLSDRKKGRLRLRYSCDIHGEQSASVQNFISSGRGCPGCAGQNQRQCYINLVKDGDLPVALKFGIANDSVFRLKGQNSRNLFQMQQIAAYELTSVESCKAAERACLVELDCGILSSRELKDGYTETTSIQNLEEIIGIYERFGGVKVN